jgi:mono/diheme cytochrome c family protein
MKTMTLSKATCLFALSLVLTSNATAQGKLEYNRDIRPILAENCFACHGPDSASRKAGLRLDKREVAVQAGAIAPGTPDKSELIRRVFDSGKDHMPPAVTRKVLSTEQKDKLKQWIAAGAEYQKHWSLIAPTRATLPVVKNTAWVRNPIDRFVLAKLEEKGLMPAPEADRRTLARRLSLDLTGLPPAPADVEAFVNDKSPDYYEKFVDKLQESPHWGEHRGRYWLDAARYADSHGIHFDNFREIWSYRDWVIKAFNANMKFDQFTIEQLAGDLLPNRTLDEQIASGFNRCNITTNEGGAIDEEYLVLYARDRTETVSQVWLGMTAGCAVCHDHKFDPIATRDFYSMSAFFNNTTQRAMDGNIKDTPPIIFVPKPEDRPKFDALAKETADARKLIDARKKAARTEYDSWVKTVKPESLETPIPTDGLKVAAALNEGAGKTLNFTIDGKARPVTLGKDAAWDAGQLDAKAFRSSAGEVVSLSDAGDFDHGQSFSYGAWVKLPRAGLTGAIFSRMDEGNDFRGWDFWIQNNLPGAHIISKWQENAVKAVATTQLKPKQWHHVFITYDGSGRAAGIKVYIDGVAQSTTVEADSLRSTIKTGVPFKLSQRNNSSRIDGVALQDMRIYNRALTPREVEALARSSKAVNILKKPADKRSDAEKSELFDWWLGSFDQPYQQLNKRLVELAKEEASLRTRGTIAHVMQEKPSEAMAHILFRGDYDKRRDPVKPETPKFLPPLPSDQPNNRIGFANWLLRPEHPLTARVTVNRFWQELFGNGIVKTSGDFGVAGELPSHQELLDWLAIEFRENGWDIKKFFKMLVMSATYRQSAVITPEKLEKDGQNRLLSRGPRFRMDAEMVRDYALASSGLLVRKLGGPSVKPYQPDGVWEAVAMIGSNTRDYRRDTGENLYRRSMYTFWKRAAPPASMDILNAPNRETCAVRRERTNTPLQALLTLNDPQFVEAARHLAQITLRDGGDKFESRVDVMAKRLLARSLTSEELAVIKPVFDDLAGFYKAKPEEAKKLITFGESKPDATLDPSTLAAWTMLANQMMNLDEVLNK